MWSLTFSGEFLRDVNEPVSPAYIPGNLTEILIRVRIFSPYAPTSWRLAGELVQIFEPVSGFDVEGASVILPLNSCKLVQFPLIESEDYYWLKFYPKKWIDNYEIQIEQFV